jgi:hypothetical protein
VREPLRKVHEAIVDLLNRITISDMAGDGSLCGPESGGKTPFLSERLETLHVL